MCDQILAPPTHFRKNRKLSVFRDFKEMRSNLRVKSGIIRDAEPDDVISFDIHKRTSGLNRKLSVLTDFEPISSNLRVEEGRLVNQLPRAKQEAKKSDLSTNCLERSERLRRGDWSTNYITGSPYLNLKAAIIRLRFARGNTLTSFFS